MKPPREPANVVQVRRDGALKAIVEGVPFMRFLGVTFDRRGDELTGVLNYDDDLIGNPFLQALHGGVTAAFLETTAVVALGWAHYFPAFESGDLDPQVVAEGKLLKMPKTIDFTVDYLRSGMPRDAYARARISRAGRRYASVHVEAWQDHHEKLYAQATGHFLMPPAPDAAQS